MGDPTDNGFERMAHEIEAEDAANAAVEVVAAIRQVETGKFADAMQLDQLGTATPASVAVQRSVPAVTEPARSGPSTLFSNAFREASVAGTESILPPYQYEPGFNLLDPVLRRALIDSVGHRPDHNPADGCAEDAAPFLGDYNTVDMSDRDLQNHMVGMHNQLDILLESGQIDGELHQAASNIMAHDYERVVGLREVAPSVAFNQAFNNFNTP